jgi:biopolymer transport protein ExbD
MAAKKRNAPAVETVLSLTSMMDMFTIVLVFLIKQVDTEGNLMTSADNLKLPASTSTKTPKEVNLTVVVDATHILVDGEQIEQTEIVAKQDSLIVGLMVPVLEKKREEEKKAALARGEEPDEAGSIIVQLDKNMAYDVMYKVMATCGWSGYTNISFAIIQKNAE